ncbi:MULTISPECIES: hypothetical protein [Pantoea]|uniref:hypothetical protein n=1 Tax=Pantoea TaxID=53335 RepID=UPI001B301252|nr:MULTISPECIES: hypothetical protein [Pantoea]MDJ0042568.1 hypothetical protein [Pantoea allii]
MTKLRKTTALNVIFFIASILLFLSMGAVLIASFNGWISREIAERIDLICLVIAFVTYLLDTIGALEKHPKPTDFVRATTLTTIMIPFGLRFYNQEFLVEHWIGCLLTSVGVVVVCLIWFRSKKTA